MAPMFLKITQRRCNDIVVYSMVLLLFSWLVGSTKIMLVSEYCVLIIRN